MMKDERIIKICNFEGKEIVTKKVTNDVANAFLNILLELPEQR